MPIGSISPSDQLIFTKLGEMVYTSERTHFNTFWHCPSS